ncbi:MAG: hypothetical protein R2695_13270 [Acidimicrobiales bacterium]
MPPIDPEAAEAHGVEQQAPGRRSRDGHTRRPGSGGDRTGDRLGPGRAHGPVRRVDRQGTDQVLKNNIGERSLQLPREPGYDKNQA